MKRYTAQTEVIEDGNYKIYFIEDPITYEAILMRKDCWLQRTIYKMRKNITKKDQFNELVMNGLTQAKLELCEDILDKIKKGETI